jgi:hypothetical protein
VGVQGDGDTDDEHRREIVRELIRTADELAGLADTAELMGDDANALRFRTRANQHRLRALALLDDPPTPPSRGRGTT